MGAFLICKDRRQRYLIRAPFTLGFNQDTFLSRLSFRDSLQVSSKSVPIQIHDRFVSIIEMCFFPISTLSPLCIKMESCQCTLVLARSHAPWSDLLTDDLSFVGNVSVSVWDEMLPAGTHVNQNNIWAGFAPPKTLVVGVPLIHLEFVSCIRISLGALLAYISAY